MKPVNVMKQALRVLIVLAAFFCGVSTASAQSDEAGVRAAIEQYFKGHATTDAATMRAAFLPTAHIEGIRQGATTFTDYFVLLKVDGAWKIANKVYSAAPTR